MAEHEWQERGSRVAVYGSREVGGVVVGYGTIENGIDVRTVYLVELDEDRGAWHGDDGALYCRTIVVHPDNVRRAES